MNTHRKLISLLLVIIFIFGLCSSSFAMTTQAGSETVVCYLDGKEVFLSDIGEDNIIDIDKVNSHNIGYSSFRSVPNNKKNYVIVPSKYNNAIVKTTLTAPRFTQYTTQYYFTSSLGAQFASGIDVKSSDTILATVGGFIPKIGPSVTIVFTLVSLYKAEIASKIRSRTDHKKKVLIKEMTTPYGTFYAVDDWNTRKVFTHTTYKDNSTKEVIDNLQYK